MVATDSYRLSVKRTEVETAIQQSLYRLMEGKTVAEVGVGMDYSCARASDGTTACWGGFPAGGNGTTTPSSIPGGVVGAISVADAPTVTGVTGTNATSASISWTPARAPAREGGRAWLGPAIMPPSSRAHPYFPVLAPVQTSSCGAGNSARILDFNAWWNLGIGNHG